MMGTSTNYDAPPSWGPLKSQVTRLAGEIAPSPVRVAELVRDFIAQNGGAAAVARGGGTLGSGKAAQASARSLAGFVSLASDVGLAEALRRSGLQELIGRPVTDIILGLVDYCTGPGASIDEVDARNALSQLFDEILGDATDASEVEAILSGVGEGSDLAELLEKFFGNYLCEQFCRVFYERLVKKHGDDRARSFLDEIRGFVRSALANHVVGVNVTRVDWFGDQGRRVADDIMEQTLRVFEI